MHERGGKGAGGEGVSMPDRHIALDASGATGSTALLLSMLERGINKHTFRVTICIPNTAPPFALGDLLLRAVC